MTSLKWGSSLPKDGCHAEEVPPEFKRDAVTAARRGDLTLAEVEVDFDMWLEPCSQIRVHPRQLPGHRSTDPADLPAERTTCALRDIAHRHRLAAGHREAIGVYVAAVLDTPLSWTKMRQVYALLGLVKIRSEDIVIVVLNGTGSGKFNPVCTLSTYAGVLGVVAPDGTVVLDGPGKGDSGDVPKC